MVHHETGCYPKWKAPACGSLRRTVGRLLFLIETYPQLCKVCVSKFVCRSRKKEGANPTHSHERHREAPGEKHAGPRPNGRVFRWLSRPGVKIRGFLVDLAVVTRKLLFDYYVNIAFLFCFHVCWPANGVTIGKFVFRTLRVVTGVH